jgi:hypothetical protein
MELTAKRHKQVHFSPFVGLQVNLSQAYSVNKYRIIYGMLETDQISR